MNCYSVVLKARLHFWRYSCGTVGAEHDISGPLSHRQSKGGSVVAFAVDRDRLVAMLEAIAVGTMVYASPVQFLYPVDVRDFVL
jgi:hypothetical protein